MRYLLFGFGADTGMGCVLSTERTFLVRTLGERCSGLQHGPLSIPSSGDAELSSLPLKAMDGSGAQHP